MLVPQYPNVCARKKHKLITGSPIRQDLEMSAEECAMCRSLMCGVPGTEFVTGAQ